VEFTVRGTANSLRANRRRVSRALRCEEEKDKEKDSINVWLAECASYLNRPLYAIIIYLSAFKRDGKTYYLKLILNVALKKNLSSIKALFE
jgi:hypothetical protein